MRVLAIGPQLPWPIRSGADHRSFHLLSRIALETRLSCLFLMGAKRGLDNNPLATRVERLELLPFSFPCWKGLARGFLDPVPQTIRHWESRLAQEALRQHMRSFGPYDLIVCQDLPIMPYARLAASQCSSPPPIILDRTRVDAAFQAEQATLRRHRQPLHHRLAQHINLRRLLAFERDVSQKVALQIVCADSDAAWIRKNLGSGSRVTVLPNGVDASNSPPSPHEIAVEDRVLFTGCLDYFPNEDGLCWFLDHVWPVVRALRPPAQLVVAGRSPSPALRRRLEEDQALLMADVPHMEPVIASASVVVAPIRIGGGTRVKIVEAWAAQRAVVATTRAADGLAGIDGEHLLIRDDPHAMAEAVVQLLQDASFRTRIATEGRLLAEKHYDWDVLFNDWWQEIERTLERQAGGSPAPCQPRFPATTHKSSSIVREGVP